MTDDRSIPEVQQGLPARGARLSSLFEKLLARLGGLGGIWTQRAGARRLEVIEVLSLGGRRQVALIRCADQSFLVGLGTDAVNTIVAVDASAEKQTSPELL